MKPWKRLLVYLLLNIIVTGITMLAVLYLWENTAIKELMYTTVEQASAGETPRVPDQDSPAGGDGPQRIEIEEVGGVGNLATEYILLKHSTEDTEDTVSLQNWVLRDENGHEFSILAQSGIGSLELHAKGAVYVYTKTGESNPIELYLGLQDPLWNPGETVTLISPEGEIHDTYQIP
jgi:hypothetical protein